MYLCMDTLADKREGRKAPIAQAVKVGAARVDHALALFREHNNRRKRRDIWCFSHIFINLIKLDTAIG